MTTTRISSSRRSNSSSDPGVFVSLAAAVSLLAVLAVPQSAGAQDAAALWTKNCASCHGADGKGKTKMGEKLKVRDLTSADVKAGLTKAKAVDAMKNGVKAGDKLVMKSYSDKLSEAEINALADHSLAFK